MASWKIPYRWSLYKLLTSITVLYLKNICSKVYTSKEIDTYMHKMQFLQFFLCITLLLLYCNVSRSAFLCELNQANPFKVALTSTVDIAGKGNFTTIQSAVDSIPSGNTKWIRIQIFAGVYR